MVIQWFVLQVYQIVSFSTYFVFRSWKTGLPKGACVLISTSVDHDRAEHIGGVRGVELASRYLIEPCGTGKSRLTHISRVDVR